MTPGRRTLLVGLLVAVPLLLAGAILAVLVVVRPDPVVLEPATLRTPIQFKQVAGEAPAPCAGDTVAAPADQGGCYRLGEGITVGQVADIREIPPAPDQGRTTWAISIKLRQADAARFADLTRKVAAAPQGTPGNLLAILVGDGIVSAPAVQDPIAGGDVQIAGDFTEVEAKRLIAQITGSA